MGVFSPLPTIVWGRCGNRNRRQRRDFGALKFRALLTVPQEWVGKRDRADRQKGYQKEIHGLRENVANR